MTVETLKRAPTARQIAQMELDNEQRAKDVNTLKARLRALAAAKVVVANLEREVTDIEAAIAQGNEAG